MSFEEKPELSVIVPLLDEEQNMASFMEGLAAQREVRFELILSDGGSTDNGIAEARRLSARLPFPVTVIEGGRGRAAQMNRGQAAARGETLLFLHIDSRFPDPLALRKGLDLIRSAGTADVAARFSLEFDFTPVLAPSPGGGGLGRGGNVEACSEQQGEIPTPYRFYGAKARLDRPGCTHGDQGFLIGAAFFSEIGPFDTSLPLMEDTFFAERVRRKGKWLLAPQVIRTSPRRFQEEGLRPRQTLNAILMNLAFTGRHDLILALRGSYRSQRNTSRLQLGDFLVPLQRAVGELPAEERRRTWYDTGRYVRSNAWQIPFLLDFLLGRGEAGGMFLALHDRFLARLIDNRLCDWITAGMAWGWFQVALRVARRQV